MFKHSQFEGKFATHALISAPVLLKDPTARLKNYTSDPDAVTDLSGLSGISGAGLNMGAGASDITGLAGGVQNQRSTDIASTIHLLRTYV
jgi:hypothetical protein